MVLWWRILVAINTDVRIWSSIIIYPGITHSPDYLPISVHQRKRSQRSSFPEYIISTDLHPDTLRWFYSSAFPTEIERSAEMKAAHCVGILDLIFFLVQLWVA